MVDDAARQAFETCLIIEETGWTFAQVQALTRQQRATYLGFMSGRNRARNGGNDGG